MSKTPFQERAIMSVQEMTDELADALDAVFKAVPKARRAALCRQMCCIESWANRGLSAAQVAEDEAKQKGEQK